MFQRLEPLQARFMAKLNEEVLETRYDGNVFGRLFSYVKPHTKVMLLALVLVLAVTGIDLVRPVLIGDAIDTYIEGYNVPYEYVAEEDAEVTLGELHLRRIKEEADGGQLSGGAQGEEAAGSQISDETPGESIAAEENARFARLLYYEDQYYLLEDLKKDELEMLAAWEEEGFPEAFVSQTPADLSAQEEKLASLSEQSASTQLTAEDNTASARFLRFTLGGTSRSARLLSRAELDTLRAPDRKGLGTIAAWYVALLIFGFAFQTWQGWLLQKTGQSIIFTIRQQVFEHVHSLPLRFFDTNPVGRIVTRVTNDVESLNQMYTQVLVRLVSNTVLIIGYAVVMVGINRQLAFVSFLFLPVVFGITLIFRYLIRRIYRIVRTKISSLNTFLSENISGMKLIQLFAREETKAEEFKERTDDLYKSQMKEMFTFGVFRPGLAFLANFAYALILYKSGVLVLAGSLSLGTLYIFVSYIRSFFEPIQELAEQFSTLQNAMASAEKIFTILDEKNTILEKENPVRLADFKGKIEFKNVWFAYENEDYVLKDVSFVINPGERVAFVGATGAGKSSILNLIGRYYDIQKGEILVDDVNIKDLSLKDLRRAIGQVQQDVFLFTGDVESNIRLGNEEISEEAMQAAAKASNAEMFIQKLPGGFKEPVTERGATFSAGERQLLSFARTLAYSPKILVLDEATANIDTETEQLIQDALEKLMQGRTSILVAHRLSTIQHADEILVMHKGRIRERGTHQELLAMDGIYKKLYELQA